MALTVGCTGVLITKRMEIWLFIVFISIISTFVHCQSSNTAGFISIDCGATANYTDEITGIWYTTDDQFIDSGVKHKIAGLSSIPSKQLSTVRSFPNGTRNCYNVPVTQFQKYLVRATFMYGNYDGLNRATAARPLLFDLHLGVNLWNTVNITDTTQTATIEAVAVAVTNSMSVCLIDKGSGTPFISALELRPLKDYMYPLANTALYLVLFIRINVGPTTSDHLRYPDDPYDRIWRPYSGAPEWTEISTTSTVENYDQDPFEAPTAVMSTAATPVNSSKMEFYWDFAPGDAPRNSFFVEFHFADFSSLPTDFSRVFNIYLNGDVWQSDYCPPYLMSGYVYNPKPLDPSPTYQWALNATAAATLLPVLNALEAYTQMDLVELPTDSGDVDAITTIMAEYHIKRNWMGDPCAPMIYSWEDLNCSYSFDSPRIISVNFSSRALTGFVSSSFARLTALEYLDLSNNDLTGKIPDILGNLPSLQFLDLSCNDLTGQIPASLLKKSQHGLLTIRFDDGSSACANSAVIFPSPSVPSPSGTDPGHDATWRKIRKIIIWFFSALGGTGIPMTIAIIIWRKVHENKIKPKPGSDDTDAGPGDSICISFCTVNCFKSHAHR